VAYIRQKLVEIPSGLSDRDLLLADFGLSEFELNARIARDFVRRLPELFALAIEHAVAPGETTGARGARDRSSGKGMNGQGNLLVGMRYRERGARRRLSAMSRTARRANRPVENGRAGADRGNEDHEARAQVREGAEGRMHHKRTPRV